MKLGQAIAMANQVFNKRFDKTNVIALWTEDQLKTFSSEELLRLRQHSQDEMRYSSSEFRTKINRLLIRISNVERSKEEAN